MLTKEQIKELHMISDRRNEIFDKIGVVANKRHGQTIPIIIQEIRELCDELEKTTKR